MPKTFRLAAILLSSLLGWAGPSLAANPAGAAEGGLLVQLAPDLRAPVASLAFSAASCAALKSGGQPVEKLAVIDYSRPSTEKRFWLFDLAHRRLLLEDLVAHGKGSGENFAVDFSNAPGSLKSSLGLFRIGQIYFGKHGKSLRLIGLEPGFNDQAEDRAIVIHGADYVSPSFVQLHQRLGRSFGCPALSPESAEKTIESVGGSSGYLFSYYPDPAWLENSAFLQACKGI